MSLPVEKWRTIEQNLGDEFAITLVLQLSAVLGGISIPITTTTTTVRSLSETSKRTAYMQVLFDVSERERTVADKARALSSSA